MQFLRVTQICLFAIISAIILFGYALAQDQDENVRGAFLTSRPAASSPPKHRNRRRRKNTQHDATGQTQPDGQSSATSGAESANASSTNNGSGSPSGSSTKGPIGVGYSLYLRNSRGEAVRVDPSRQFHANESFRIELESNTDGYLYVFHTENGASAEMIFPDARLSGGDNEIDAHVPIDIPSNRETEERFRWFTFDNYPATESLYIVVTREPLDGVPTDEELVKYCAASGAVCPWRPPATFWAQLKASAKGNAIISKSQTFGQAETATEREAVSRGLGLDRRAPPPSIIRMSASSTAPALVTALDLIHK